MTMRINRLPTYWTAEEADTVVGFIDELRDRLWETYGDEIIEMRCNARADTDLSNQAKLAFDDDIDF